MSRNFFGGKIGGFGPKNPGGRNASGKRDSGMVVDKKTGQSRPMTDDEKYKKLFEEKMASYQKDYGAGNKYSFQLPGTKNAGGEQKEMSKGAKAILEKIAAVTAKREAKKSNNIKIQPKSYGGMYPGRVDAKGNIYNSQNQVIAKINLKNGRISNSMGFSLGKYKPDDNFSDFRISKIIANAAMSTLARQNAQNNSGWNPMTGGVGAPPSSSGGGSIYGDTGGFWGNSGKDDDNKGWW